jgi:pimeloyl-ACP methyl ester carboxylesterase
MSKQRAGQRHKNKVYFKDAELDFYLQAFPLGYQTYGGATVGESFYAASRIREKDPDSWVAEWSSLGARLEDAAVRSMDAGHHTSARDAYLRAFTYYRTSTPLLRATDPRFRATCQTMRTCFLRAAELFDPPIEPVSVPFEGGALLGYFMKAEAGTEPRPTLIMIGGGETYAEDLYFWGGTGAVARGYNAILVDMPGQGATPFEGMHHRFDVEIPMGAVLDYLEGRPDVDMGRVAAYGISLGGYIVLRSAAHDGRIKACAASTPIIDWHQTLVDAVPSILRRAPRPLFGAVMKLGRLFSPTQLIAYEKFFEWQVGATSIVDALEKFRPWKVDVARISCPVLCMVGAGEADTFKTQTFACYAALRGQKAMRIFTEEEGADAHSQATNLRLAHQAVFDFFDQALAREGQRAELWLAQRA